MSLQSADTPEHTSLFNNSVSGKWTAVQISGQSGQFGKVRLVANHFTSGAKGPSRQTNRTLNAAVELMILFIKPNIARYSGKTPF